MLSSTLLNLAAWYLFQSIMSKEWPTFICKINNPRHEMGDAPVPEIGCTPSAYLRSQRVPYFRHEMGYPPHLTCSCTWDRVHPPQSISGPRGYPISDMKWITHLTWHAPVPEIGCTPLSLSQVPEGTLFQTWNGVPTSLDTLLYLR